MQTVIIDRIPQNEQGEYFVPPGHAILEAARAIRRGELVAFPTETVYGLGANALDPTAVRRIFEAKGRPSDNPLIVHVHSIGNIAPLVSEIPPYANVLIRRFMPGPITLVFRKSALIPDAVTAGLGTVGIRVPSHPIAQLFLRLAEVPVAAPSANRSGSPSPTEPAHVIADLNGRIPYIIAGGSSDYGLESTVVDVTGDRPAILRPGAVTAEEIAACCGSVTGIGSDFEKNTGFSNAVQGSHAGVPKAPGMKYRHYAPNAEIVLPLEPEGEAQTGDMLRLLRKARETGRNVGIYAGDKTLKALRASGIPFEGLGFSPSDSVIAASAGLFGALRRLDDAGADRIIVQTFPARGFGTAYMNRLLKAAGTDGGSAPPPIQRVLFVCAGNTCRSPMAEYYYNDRMGSDRFDKCRADSAGISTHSGLEATREAIRAMDELFGIDLKTHRSSRIDGQRIGQADLILTMERGQKDRILESWPEHGAKVYTLPEYASGSPEEIRDPFGKGIGEYKEAARQIAGCIDGMIDKIRKNNLGYR